MKFIGLNIGVNVSERSLCLFKADAVFAYITGGLLRAPPEFDVVFARTSAAAS
jgi:hypothetical protein